MLLVAKCELKNYLRLEFFLKKKKKIGKHLKSIVNTG